jgi:hypothetical protein
MVNIEKIINEGIVFKPNGKGVLIADLGDGTQLSMRGMSVIGKSVMFFTDEVDEPVAEGPRVVEILGHSPI